MRSADNTIFIHLIHHSEQLKPSNNGGVSRLEAVRRRNQTCPSKGWMVTLEGDALDGALLEGSDEGHRDRTQCSRQMLGSSVAAYLRWDSRDKLIVF
jgi:hypothetical protein